MITDTLCVDCSLFTRTNILARRFAKCSRVVKIACLRLTVFVYMMLVCGRDTSSVHLTNYLPATINIIMKLFFGYKRRDSVTHILFDLGLPCFDTIVHNSKAVLSLSCSNSCNAIVHHSLLVI